MQTADSGLLFQTTSQLTASADHQRKLAATRDVGSPIHLSGKVLDFQILGNEAWTAESGWQARCVDIMSGETRRLYKGHQGPVTSVVLREIKPDDASPRWLALFTGSWDKTIRVWDAKSGELLSTLVGHTDFVKSLTLLPSPRSLLLSTSSDRTLRLWELSPLSSRTSPLCIQVVRESHARPVECAACRLNLESDDSASPSLDVWTGDSMGIIKRWALEEKGLRHIINVPGHETAVAAMSITDEGLWSVSADKTAMLCPAGSTKTSTISHTGYVKCILPLPSDIAGQALIITGSEDEDIRLWDVTTFPESPARLVSNVQGHCGEVTVMRWWRARAGGSEPAWVLLSGSLDGTIRRWTLQELLHPKSLELPPAMNKESLGLTAEEELELAELMSDASDE